MHTLRLLHECKELVSEGHISLPGPERDFLIRVRTGTYSVDKVQAMAQKLFSECGEAARLSSLPEKWIGLLCLVFSPIVTVKLG